MGGEDAGTGPIGEVERGHAVGRLVDGGGCGRRGGGAGLGPPLGGGRSLLLRGLLLAGVGHHGG